nr:PREDICTED: uncharacterized protein LOC109036165 [Bemisia tabaci]
MLKTDKGGKLRLDVNAVPTVFSGSSASIIPLASKNMRTMATPSFTSTKQNRPVKCVRRLFDVAALDFLDIPLVENSQESLLNIPGVKPFPQCEDPSNTCDTATML